MPQIIKPYIRQSGALQDWFEVLVDEAIHIHRPSKLRNEDEIHGFGPLFWINDRAFLCSQNGAAGAVDD